MKTFKSIILAITLLITSCAPQTKEAYLQNYKGFILKTEKNHDTYTNKHWNNADRELKEFSGKLYSKYEKELTWQEEIIVKKYEIQYNFYKMKSDSKSLFDTSENEEYIKLKKDINYYYENDMQKDIEELIKQAKIAGDSTAVIINQIIEELNKEQHYK